MNASKKDLRPDPKPRKNALLWQSYLLFDELSRMNVRHKLRISSITKGKSNLDLGFEHEFLNMFREPDTKKPSRKISIPNPSVHTIDEVLNELEEAMKGFGLAANPDVWRWMTSLKGIKTRLAAPIMAQIDDIAKFSNISKLWRFAGYAVIDGKRERPEPGMKSHYNRRLKSTCYLCSKSFVMNRTPFYRELYDGEKVRLRQLYPEKVKENNHFKYTDGHINNMALRKISKVFLAHIWIIWRQSEGLPLTNPYAIDILKHADLMKPPMMDYTELNETLPDVDEYDEDIEDGTEEM